ncbi:hypothetical protein DSO57_1014529 [Entomophthora muscae]|uniref:Uncharacterized protein n=1 Tax=Entomophthora muscae TaxID=34485 RepID=A0ACC2U366_9FUNG|nr:hypothetical protein DSO57_1014529 [Entomophthora muscae]
MQSSLRCPWILLWLPLTINTLSIQSTIATIRPAASAPPGQSQPIILNNYIPVTVANENKNANANELGGTGTGNVEAQKAPMIDGSLSIRLF